MKHWTWQTKVVLVMSMLAGTAIGVGAALLSPTIVVLGAATAGATLSWARRNDDLNLFEKWKPARR